MRRKKINGSKLCCLVLALLPILQMYGFSVLTLADISVILLIIFSLIKTKKISNLYWLFLVFILLFQPFVAIEGSSNLFLNKTDAIGTAWRLALFTLVICFVPKKVVKEQSLRWAFRIVGCANAVYAVLQFISGTFFKISLTPYIPFLPIARIGIEEQQLGWIAYGWNVRARAFFAEPSHLSIYLLLTMALELFQKRRNKIILLIYLLGVVVSFSSTGFVGLVFLLFVFLVVNRRFFARGFKKQEILIGGVLVVALFVCLIGSGYIGSVINHMFGDGGGLVSQSHFSDIRAAFSQSASIFEMVFGRGMQNVVSGYIPGWIRVYYCLGLIGLFAYLLAYVLLWLRIDKGGKAILVLFVFLNTGTEIMCGPFLPLYMLAALAYSKSAHIYHYQMVSGRDLGRVCCAKPIMRF